MSVKICIFLLCVLLLLATASCGSQSARTQQSAEPQKSTTTSASPSDRTGEQKRDTDTTASAKAAFDACALITPAEISVVMGQPVKETKGSNPTSNQTGTSFERWQCFYTVDPFNKSVSLELARNNPKGSQSAMAEFWKETFQEAKAKKKSDKPKAVAGVGDEAFWVGDNKTGALYVLKNNSYLRISIGGPDDEAVKTKKLKALAQNALKRL
jgi:hypothetical protein